MVKNKTAPKLFEDTPVYSAQFYAKRIYDAFGMLMGYQKKTYDEYAILLPPNEFEIISARGRRRKTKSVIPDNYRLVEYLFSMIYFRQGIAPGNKYPYLNVEKCLDYHYLKYAGDKLQFLDFTEHQLTIELYTQFEGSISHDNTKKRINNWCNEKRRLLNKDQGQSELMEGCKLTARQLLFIDYYKVMSRIIPNPTSPEEYGKPGTQRYKKYYSVFGTKENFKPANQKDLNTIIPLLKEYPLAQKAAVNDLDKMQ